MIDDQRFLEYGQEMVVIREIFDDAHELFENELEMAFECGYPTIVIEPCRLGEETARWIFFGEYLTKYSILTGLGSIASVLVWPDRIFLQYSLLGTALLAHGLHLISWQQDICSNYRVEPNPEQFLRLLAANQNKQQHRLDNVSLLTSTTDVNFPLTEPSTSSDKDTSSSTESTESQHQQQQNILDPKHDPGSTIQDPQSITQQKSSQHQPQTQQHRPIQTTTTTTTTNPYEMILSTSARKNKSPVVLCRRNQHDLKRSRWINAAVSLLAIAFSFIRLVRTTFITEKLQSTNNNQPYANSSINDNKWSFLKALI